MMGMYAQILCSALDEWVEELTGTALLEYALLCRAEMLEISPRRGDGAGHALAAEIAYDRALCKLCEDRGIAIDAPGFSHPAQARAHLEAELVTVGIELAALARRRRA
jgi:hypothetical protein